MSWDYELGGCPALSSYGRMAEIQKVGPVLQVEAAGGYPGYLMATRYDVITEILQDPETWSSHSVVALEPEPDYQWIPEMLDPPVHTNWRRLLAPHFTPQAAKAYEDRVRSYCASLIDGLVGKETIDFTNDFARIFPTQIFLEIFGLPESDLEQFLHWEDLIIHRTSESDPDRSKMKAAMDEVIGYFATLIATRRQDPSLQGEDVLSAALGWEIDGEPIPDAELLTFCLFMFIAGLDTVAAQLAWTFNHLATHDGHRQRLVDDPECASAAVEEYLRAFPIVVTGRKATTDTEIAGVPVKAGQTVMLPLQAAGRDPEQYADPETVDFDRKVTRHVAFGVGPHRCLGAHLARVELKVALQEWHKRIPNYRLANEPTEHTAGAWGIDHLVLRPY
ncbi:hypothetical protein JL15_02870 [Mycolicibacterium phlei DSM 43071]|nr:hypothetical protein JL15_02870 [Mycolicibacterium phlei DSM 43071]